MGVISVSPAQWLAVAIFLVLAILASTQLAAIWRGQQPRRWPEWLARSLPACVVGGWLMIAARAPIGASPARGGLAAPLRFGPGVLVYRRWHERVGDQELRLSLERD